MAAADSWYNLLIARFFLGFAVGAKSSTTPVYAAESAPKNIRGALTMMWQMWTAFGIMLGFIVSVAFQNVTFLGRLSPWRWMLGSTSIPPFIVCLQVYFCPESPRWYMEKGKFVKAFDSLCRLRKHKIQAARDMYYAYKLLEVEAAERAGRNPWKEFFGVRRNRRAAQSAFFVMFMQQFCVCSSFFLVVLLSQVKQHTFTTYADFAPVPLGRECDRILQFKVSKMDCSLIGLDQHSNYFSSIFRQAGFSTSEALLTSMGTGITNFVFAIPAIYTIDTFGRRNLLLTTFPLMGICLLWCGMSFYLPVIDDGTPEGKPTPQRLGSIAAAIYVFMACYSPGEGPVPFTYSAEAFPLHLRDIGMSFATATCWGFNFILSLTWPALVEAFTEQGAFGWYAAWNFFGWVYCYFLLPETKGLTLEELDTVFDVGNRQFASYYTAKLPWYIQTKVLRKDLPPMSPLYELHDETPVGQDYSGNYSGGVVANETYGEKDQTTRM
jgi:MFS family permease